MLDPKESLCWNCKYGLCLRTKQIVQFPEDETDQDIDSVLNGNNEMHEHVAETVTVSCFWHPVGAKISHSNDFNIVQECNRYTQE
jgi:hypothetical protein